MKTSLLFRSCCALGCLFLILIPLLFFYFIYDVQSDAAKPKAPESSVVSVDESLTKTVVANIILVSDIESDFNSLENFVQTINEEPADAIFVLGDITILGVRDDFVRIKEIFNESKASVYYVPGDRDLWKSGGSTKNFKAILGANYQVVDVKGSKFLLIDNANEYEGIDGPQFEFIQKNISGADYVLMHNPIYFNDSILGIIGKGMGQYSADVNDQRIKLLSVVRDAPLVKATFAGDQHAYSLTDDAEKSSLSHVILGSLSSIRNVERPNYVQVKIYEDKTFSVEKIMLPLESSDTVTTSATE